MLVRVAPVRCKLPRLFCAMARVSVPKRVPPGTQTMSLAMAVAPVAAPAQIELQVNSGFDPGVGLISTPFFVGWPQ